jgi:hypothetical protein
MNKEIRKKNIQVQKNVGGGLDFYKHSHTVSMNVYSSLQTFVSPDMPAPGEHRHLKPEEQKRHRLSWSGQSAKLSQ